MKRENDELVDLFRSKLSQSAMPVREDSWEKINSGIAFAKHHRRTVLMRIASVAAVLFVLMASSAAFWFLSPRDEIEQAFTQLEASNTNILKGDDVYQSFTPPSFVAAVQQSSSPLSGIPVSQFEDEDSVEISFSFSFSITSIEENSYKPYVAKDYWHVGTGNQNETSSSSTASSYAEVSSKQASSKNTKWAAKVSGGVSLPDKAVCNKLPFTLGATMERQLNKYLAVEAGLQYANVPSVDNKLHYIGIPIKLNANFVDTKKLNIYATVGGIADKCIAGAPNNDFKSEPIQLAVTAGVGASYKLNDQLALFVEPGITHHFKTDSQLETTRSKRPTNFNVICGLRMAF